MSTTDIRRNAVRRSNLRTFVRNWLGDDSGSFDIDGMVDEMARRNVDADEMATNEFWGIAARHEFDDKGVTDAMLAAAVERSRTGWLAVIRRPDGEIAQLSLNMGGADETEESAEARLRDVVQFPDNTVISIFPLVG